MRRFGGSLSEEILININQKETRVAIAENGVLQEILVERASKIGLLGNIYKGKVARVLPGMQAAFVDIGLEKAAFLHLNDIINVSNDYLSQVEFSEDKGCITEVLKDGQEIAVQVIKDPLGTKGARLTTRLALPSRLLVYMPDLIKVGISQRIEDLEERERLKNFVESLGSEKGGYIVRTAAEDAPEEEIKKNKEYLVKQWQDIQQKISQVKPGKIIFENLPLYLRALQDFCSPKTEKIKIDDKVTYEKAIKFVSKFMPNMVDKIEYYEAERPLFDIYAIEDEIQKALERKVPLKSGGHICFDQTEAMTTIDVNTGGFVGHRNLEETIFKTNLESATTIARQLRLRNLGGIIIIDFIDMQDEEHKQQVLAALEKSLAKDHTKYTISEVTSLGLVEMTRKRTRESLEHVLCEPCHYCSGRGTIKTAETVCYEIIREILRAERAYNPKSYLVLASQSVVDKLLEEEPAGLSQIEEMLNKSIRFQVESLYFQEQFDVVLV